MPWENWTRSQVSGPDSAPMILCWHSSPHFDHAEEDSLEIRATYSLTNLPRPDLGLGMSLRISGMQKQRRAGGGSSSGRAVFLLRDPCTEDHRVLVDTGRALTHLDPSPTTRTTLPSGPIAAVRLPLSSPAVQVLAVATARVETRHNTARAPPPVFPMVRSIGCSSLSPQHIGIKTFV